MFVRVRVCWGVIVGVRVWVGAGVMVGVIGVRVWVGQGVFVLLGVGEM